MTLLSNRARKLIEKIRDSEDQELTCAKPGGWWVDNHRVFAPTCFELLRLCLIRRSSFSRDDYEIYELYDEALEMLGKESKRIRKNVG